MVSVSARADGPGSVDAHALWRRLPRAEPARVWRWLRRSHRRTRWARPALSDVVASVLDALDLDRPARHAVCVASRVLTGADTAVLLEPRDEDGLVTTAAIGRPLLGLPLSGHPSCPAVRCSRTGAAVHVADLRELPGVSQEFVERAAVGGVHLQPVPAASAPHGVLALGWNEPRGELPAEIAAALGVLALGAGRAIELDRQADALRRDARTDPLTGLANRRGWQEALERELARVGRGEPPPCVAIMDFDRFKAYNDTSGHPAGDRLLRETARVWSELLRAGDVIARLGGDEFALLLPASDLAAARLTVDRLRTATPRGQATSAGIVRHRDDETAAKLVARADSALYHDKARQGRPAATAAPGGPGR